MTEQEIKKDKRNWLKIGVGVLISIVGIVIGYIGNLIVNPFVIVFGLAFIIGGGYLAKSEWQTGAVVKIGEATPTQVNSMTLYRDRLVFEDVLEPQGFPHLCLDDGKMYYWHWMPEKELLVLTLEDGIREFPTSPREVGGILEGTSVKEVLQDTHTTTIQAVSMAAMAGIIIFEIIALIAMA